MGNASDNASIHQSGRQPGFVRELVAATLVVAFALVWRSWTGGPAADATPPQAPPTATPAAPKPLALVNGAEISAEQLAAECLARHGATVLETLVNRTLIEQACRKAGVTVTAADVTAEIEAMAKRFSVPTDKWLELIEKERGIKPQQYADDIVWPMLALRILAREAGEPTTEEIRTAYETRFGPAIKARIIAARTREVAEQLRTQAVAAPDEFGALARQHSVDVGSASANGWVQPIRLHSGDPAFDRAAFALEPGEISPVVQVADQFLVIKCEGRLPAAEVTLADATPGLTADLRERKSRQASTEVFRGIQDSSRIENVLNDPARSQATPGVAALVNGEPIAIEKVRGIAVERHGQEVLEILITRTLIGQALARQQQAVVQADLDAEVARAATSMGFKRADGSPDVEAWLERVTREEKIPLRHYMEDVVWPSVALKKLVGGVPVLKEDLDKAFAATFGPRAKCRIIVLDSQRRAQEVWQLARKNPTAEAIGALAETYSVDPTTRALRGEVPPIQRFGGQPTLEREVFALSPGELSGVVQIADRFMVFLCEGYTEPRKVDFKEVRDELYVDIEEKKQRIEMARYFSHLREGAAIDNFLAGTSQSPAAERGGMAAAPPVATPGAELPGGTADDLARPRTGSRRAAAPPDGVRRASFEDAG
ncbi:MAG: peptidylprolyl isomerase, partial [Planctomycetota bacterium]